MSRQWTILTALLLAQWPAAVLADHVPTEIMWPGWCLQSGEELYQQDSDKFPDYPLTHLLDGDPNTCWVYRGKPPKEKPAFEADYMVAKPWIRLVPCWPVTLDGIGVINGYAKSDKLYYRNDRAAKIRITLNEENYAIRPQGAEQTSLETTLADEKDVQKISFKRQKVCWLKIEITQVRPGKVHDLCISELELYYEGKKVDPCMPAAVRYSPGDECGCGMEFTWIRRSGKRLFFGIPDSCLWEDSDPTGRYLGHVARVRGKRFELQVVDTHTGEVINRQFGQGKVGGLEWADRSLTLVLENGDKPLHFALPQEAILPPDHPNYEDWRESWQHAQWLHNSDGTRRIIWSVDGPRDICRRWAGAQGLTGLTHEEVEKKFGTPVNVIPNSSGKSVLHVYPEFCVSIRQGKCDGWAPRAENYEKWFAQEE